MLRRTFLRWSVLATGVNFGLFNLRLAASGSPPDSEAWGKLLYEMQSKLGNLDDKSRWVHLLPIASFVTWGSPAGEDDLWDTGDAVPELTLLYSKSDARFSLNWEQFLYAVDLGKKAGKNPARDSAENAWRAAVKARNDLETSITQTYVADQGGKPKRFWDPWYVWWVKRAGTPLAIANKKVSDALADYAQYLDPKDAINIAYSSVLQYLSAGRLSSGFDPKATDEDNQQRLNVLRHPYKLAGDIKQFVADGELNRAGDKWAFQWSIDHTSTTDHRESSNLGGSYSFASFVHLDGSGAHSSIDTTSATFKMLISFRNLVKMEIKPAGGWFDAGLYDALKRYPIKPGHTREEFFGPKGSLTRRPIEVVLAYQPQLEATFSRSEYHFFEQTLSGGGGFNIGCFHFGGGGSTKITDVRTDGNTVSFKAASVSTGAELMAVISKIES